jgi:hypothetical protein
VTNFKRDEHIDRCPDGHQEGLSGSPKNGEIFHPSKMAILMGKMMEK